MTSQIATAVVLAAGQGKRMKSELPKVLHTICGRPMLHFVLDAVAAVHAARTVVVLGHGYEQVVPHVPPDCVVALQHQQLGTGHAVLAAADHILPGPLLVVPGDTPLVTGEVLQRLAAEQAELGAAATVLTMELEDPTGYGRIVRAPDGSVLYIVEHRDASPDELTVQEVNSGMYVLTAPLALEVLAGVKDDNDQGEVYLTDVIAELRARGEKVAAYKVADSSLVLGVNSQEELEAAEALMIRRRDGDERARVREQ